MNEELTEIGPIFEEDPFPEEREKKKKKVNPEEDNELQTLYDKLREKLDPNCVGLDYGAYKSHFSSVIKKEIKTTPENNAFDSCVMLGVEMVDGKKVLCTDLLDEDIYKVYQYHELSNIIYHIKNKLGFQLLNKKYTKENTKDQNNDNHLIVHTKDKSFQTPSVVAFNKSIVTFINKYKTYPFLKDVLNPNTDILLSHPNYFSLSQVATFKNSFQETLPLAIPNWNGNIYLYSESECALFSVLKDLKYIDDSIIIDQGDSTTNITSIKFKQVGDKIQLSMYHDGITIGGSVYSDIVKDMAKVTFVKSKEWTTAIEHYIKRSVTNIKISLLREGQNEIYKGEIKGIEYKINRSEYLRRCEKVYKTINSFIEDHLKKVDICPKNIIYTGGGLRNPLQRQFIEENAFADFIQNGANVHPDNLEKRVVDGLHYRHALEKVGGIIIEESCPYSIYTLIRTAKGSGYSYDLQLVLPKGKNEFRTNEILFEPSTNSVVSYPLFQVDSTNEVISLKGNELLQMLEIGSVSFHCDSNNKWNAWFTSVWRDKKLHFKIQDGKTTENVDFEMFKEMTKVTFTNVVQEYK